MKTVKDIALQITEPTLTVTRTNCFLLKLDTNYGQFSTEIYAEIVCRELVLAIDWFSYSEQDGILTTQDPLSFFDYPFIYINDSNLQSWKREFPKDKKGNPAPVNYFLIYYFDNQGKQFNVEVDGLY